MYKISSELLNYVFPESRTAYYDEACSRLTMIQTKAIIPADQLGPKGQSIGDIAFVEVHINSQYLSEAGPYFYSISSSQNWPGQIWIWGWVSIDNVRELSKQGWVYTISMPKWNRMYRRFTRRKSHAISNEYSIVFEFSGTGG